MRQGQTMGTLNDQASIPQVGLENNKKSFDILHNH